MCRVASSSRRIGLNSGVEGRWKPEDFDAVDFDGRREEPTEAAREDAGLEDRAEPACGWGDGRRESLADPTDETDGRREEVADAFREAFHDVAVVEGEGIRDEEPLLNAADLEGRREDPDCLTVGLEALRFIVFDKETGGCKKLALRTRP